ncbi:MAG: hypothetical protein HZC18_06195 [Candidatus Omnitrophica bacterium]|nr:hypothetical protein [Candidatus Omnitrophota bacterium]
MSLALVYLARGASDGLSSVKEFFEAYRRYPADCAHELIVIIKGWAGLEGEAEVRQLSLAHNAKVIDLPDDGFDWGAYMRAASLLTHDWICFLNTHSRPRVKNWLDLLMKGTEVPGINVGAVGATASYESLISIFYWPSCIAFLLYIPRIFLNALRFAIYSRNAFRSFPNPHLRSNAFIVRRELFVDFAATHKIPRYKRDAWILESGRTGFTAFLASRGLKPLVAGADGKYYEPEQWIKSGTFRVPRQPNLLVEDNQTMIYDKAGSRNKRILEKNTWGRIFENVEMADARECP